MCVCTLARQDANRASASAKSVYPETGATGAAETGSCGSSLATSGGAPGAAAAGTAGAAGAADFGSCGSTWGMGAVKGPSVAR